MILIWRRALAAGLVLAVGGLAGCGSDGGAEADPASPAVVVTTTIWADVVSNVACNDEVAVSSLLPAGADPHAYEPSLRDAETLADAELIVTNGLGLEEALADPLAAAANDGVPVFAVGDHVPPIGEDDGVDPHVWFDPTRVAAALPALGEALVAAGADATSIERCVNDYTAELEALDASLETTLAAIPADRRQLVTNHDSLGYFADRYGFEILGTVIPAASTLAEASPAELQELADVIEAAGVPAIFAENLSSIDDASALAYRLGVAVVALYTDALGEEGSGAESYVDLLRTDAALLAEALSDRP